MQPNQSYPPTQDSDQNDTPDITPPQQTEAPWDNTPPAQSVTPQQPVQPQTPPQQPSVADYSRYQPQPQQTSSYPPTEQAPAPISPQSATPSQPGVTQPVQPQQSVPINPSPANAQTPIPAPAPLSPFEQQYQAALTTPPLKRSRKGLIIASIITALLLLGGGAAAYLWVQDQNDPEKRFYRAVENHLSTKYIEQDYIQELSGVVEVQTTLKSTSDFTDPKSPKSRINYSLNSDAASFDSTGELIALDDKEYFAKLTEKRDFEGLDPQYIPAINQWYRVDNEDFGGLLLLNPGSLTENINTSTGEMLVGNFSVDARADLMKFIKDNDVYTINSSKDVTIDGQKMTQYDIEFNTKSLNELNKKAVKALGLPEDTYEDKSADEGQNNTLWIDHTANRIAKVELTRDSTSIRDDGEKAKDISTVTLRYPTSASQITKPSDVKDVPWKDL